MDVAAKSVREVLKAEVGRRVGVVPASVALVMAGVPRRDVRSNDMPCAVVEPVVECREAADCAELDVRA